MILARDVREAVVKIMASIDMPLHPGQIEILDNFQRFNVIVCGRRWGKSYMLAVICLAYLLVKPNCRCWLVSPQDYHNREVMYYLDEILRRLGQPHKYQQTPKHRMIVGQSIIECRSTENPKSLRGSGLDALLIDEACQIDNFQEIWDFCLRPTLADRQGDAYAATSPNGRDHIASLLENPSWQGFQQPTWNNPHIPTSEIDEMRRSMPENVFRSEIGAEIVDDFGAAFPHKPIYVESLPDEPMVYIHGADWGWADPFAVLSLAKTVSGNIYIYDEIYQTSLTPQQQGEMASKRLKNSRDQLQPIVYADASTFTADGRQSIADQWREAGFIVRKATRDRKGTLQLLRVLLQQQKLYVVKSACKNFNSEFNGAQIDKKNIEDITGADHLLDCLRYALAGIYYAAPEVEPEIWTPAYIQRQIEINEE